MKYLIDTHLSWAAYHLFPTTFYVRYKNNIMSDQDLLTLYRVFLEQKQAQLATYKWWEIYAKKRVRYTIKELYILIFKHLMGKGDNSHK